MQQMTLASRWHHPAYHYARDTAFILRPVDSCHVAAAPLVHVEPSSDTSSIRLIYDRAASSRTDESSDSAEPRDDRAIYKCYNCPNLNPSKTSPTTRRPSADIPHCETIRLARNKRVISSRLSRVYPEPSTYRTPRSTDASLYPGFVRQHVATMSLRVVFAATLATISRGSTGNVH